MVTELEEKKYWLRKAQQYDVRFDGIQHFKNAKPLPMFTHRLYGTFVVSSYETLPAAILRKKKQFTPAEADKPKMGEEEACV
jgi:hypothetical protein